VSVLIGLIAAGILAVAGKVDGALGIALTAAAIFAIVQTAWSLRVEGRRHAVDRLATTGVYATFILAATPLIAVLATVFVNGMKVINATFLTHSMRNVDPQGPGGGLQHAIVGTFQQVGLATLIGVPIGILAAIYLVEYSADAKSQRLAKSIGFVVDVMTGVPSVIIGLFVYTAFILTLGLPRSGFAAAIALAILMLPVVVRSTEEMLRIVPRELREASLALGIPRWRTITKVVLPTALAGIITGVMLAIARVAGETAPLLLTTFLSQSFNYNAFKGPQAALPTFIWDQFTSGTQASQDRAWGGALVLITIVMLFYAGARLVARFTGVKKS
jgi:phosphate transport system permease protein